MWEKRIEMKLPLRPVLLHAGYPDDAEKSTKVKALEIWAADEWRPGLSLHRDGNQAIRGVHIANVAFRSACVGEVRLN